LRHETRCTEMARHEFIALTCTPKITNSR
jgi:hypothetical protein